jgi:hypothetical protein
MLHISPGFESAPPLAVRRRPPPPSLPSAPAGIFFASRLLIGLLCLLLGLLHALSPVPTDDETLRDWTMASISSMLISQSSVAQNMGCFRATSGLHRRCNALLSHASAGLKAPSRLHLPQVWLVKYGEISPTLMQPTTHDNPESPCPRG